MEESLLSGSWINESDTVSIEAGVMKESFIKRNWIIEKNTAYVEAGLMCTS